MRSLVSITFDDGLRCQFEKALPILDQHGFKGTFFLSANQDPTHDLWNNHTDDWWKIDWRNDDIAMLRALVRGGHEIGSHSVSHHPDKLKLPDRADLEASESKILIEGWVGTKVSSFCYPFYWSHAYLANSVKNVGYEQARGGGTPPQYIPMNSYYSLSDSAAIDRFNIDCRQISQSEDVSGWLRPGCWHVLTFHGIGDERDGWEPISAEQFTAHVEELARRRDSGAAEVVTFAEGAARLRTLN